MIYKIENGRAINALDQNSFRIIKDWFLDAVRVPVLKRVRIDDIEITETDAVMNLLALIFIVMKVTRMSNHNMQSWFDQYIGDIDEDMNNISIDLKALIKKDGKDEVAVLNNYFKENNYNLLDDHKIRVSGNELIIEPVINSDLIYLYQGGDSIDAALFIKDMVGDQSTAWIIFQTDNKNRIINCKGINIIHQDNKIIVFDGFKSYRSKESDIKKIARKSLRGAEWMISVNHIDLKPMRVVRVTE